MSCSRKPSKQSLEAASSTRDGYEDGGGAWVSVALACRTFQISETCYRNCPTLSSENEKFADWLERLTEDKRTGALACAFCICAMCRAKRSGGPHPPEYQIPNPKQKAQTLPTRSESCLHGSSEGGGLLPERIHSRAAYSTDSKSRRCERRSARQTSQDLTFHDLRGPQATRLAIAGCSEAEIATITGHSMKDVGAILDEHYLSRDSQLAESAIKKLEMFEHRNKTPK